jgi:hypothetical protein
MEEQISKYDDGSYETVESCDNVVDAVDEDSQMEMEDGKSDCYDYLAARLHKMFNILNSRLRNKKIIYWVLKFIVSHASDKRLGDEFREVTGYKFMKIVDNTSSRIYFGLLWDIMREVKEAQVGNTNCNIDDYPAIRELFDGEVASEALPNLPENEGELCRCAKNIDKIINAYIQGLEAEIEKASL